MFNLNLAIIEDDEVLLNRLTKLLNREVKDVKAFDASKKFLDDIENGYIPDVVLTDINMVNINGLEMIEILRNKNINIPVIVASAFSDSQYFLEAIKLKVRRFLIKPIDIDTLIEELKGIESEKKLKDELATKENLLLIQSKMAAMGEMLANIAHQWKQPLNSISISASSIQLAKEIGSDLDEEEFKQLIENIVNSVKYMNETISDFQNYFKPNKLEVCFHLKDTFAKVDKLLDIQFKTNNIEIIKNIDDITLCSYENELLQVLINLVKNSVDELTKIDGKRYVYIDVKKLDDESIQIEIKDNGNGINPEVLEKIFDSYFTTKGEQGTGIGLYLSKEIIQKHLNGEIKASNSKFTYNSKEYTGACFTIRLKSLEN